MNTNITKKQVAIVTGASSGMGLGITLDKGKVEKQEINSRLKTPLKRYWHVTAILDHLIILRFSCTSNNAKQAEEWS
jgi:hypothetical protein